MQPRPRRRVSNERQERANLLNTKIVQVTGMSK
jgi:hypothetical protein